MIVSRETSKNAEPGDPTRRSRAGQASSSGHTMLRVSSPQTGYTETMQEQGPSQIVELRVSSRYVTEHPWVVQAIGGFLSAYFMEQPEFRVQRHREEPESGAHLWICEVPATMKLQRLLKRLKEDIPPCQAQQISTDLPTPPCYLIDCPE